jgi:hypothetical protein
MIIFKNFLNEATKVVEPSWVDDYALGYAHLRDIQRCLSEKNIMQQLFVPKHRDPKLMKKRADGTLWRDIKLEIPDELKEASIPVSTSFRETPPGDSKPAHAFWTSTAIKLKDGTYTCDTTNLTEQDKTNFKRAYGI